MKKLFIKGTKQTPEIVFDNKSGILDISGRSIPEDSYSFYQPITDWVEEYAENPPEKTVVKVYLEYFNTSSSKFILEIFNRLKPLAKNDDGKIKVEWYYDEDDEEMMETGEDYQDVSQLPFDFIEIED